MTINGARSDNSVSSCVDESIQERLGSVHNFEGGEMIRTIAGLFAVFTLVVTASAYAGPVHMNGGYSFEVVSDSTVPVRNDSFQIGDDYTFGRGSTSYAYDQYMGALTIRLTADEGKWLTTIDVLCTGINLYAAEGWMQITNDLSVGSLVGETFVGATQYYYDNRGFSWGWDMPIYSRSVLVEFKESARVSGDGYVFPGGLSFTVGVDLQPVPLPGTMGLFGSGILTFWALARRRNAHI